MATFRDSLKTGPALQKQKRLLSVRLRQNLTLKIFSLLLSLLLYLYVQNERNPLTIRSMVVPIRRINTPSDLELEADSQATLNISGPRTLLDRLKEPDIQILADLKTLVRDDSKVQFVTLKPDIDALPPELRRDVVFEVVPARLKVQVFPPANRPVQVIALYPKEPPAGFGYGQPKVRPASVKVSGRADRVNKVDRIVVIAAPSEAGARIEGDFPVQARDKDDNPVEGIVLTPSMVKLTVPLLEEPSSKTVPISPSVSDLPLPPYSLTDIAVDPIRVRVLGRPERLVQIATIETENISIRDFTDSQEITANLIVPPDVQVRDMNDKLLSKVKLRITIRRPGNLSSPPTSVLPKEPRTDTLRERGGG